jgi:hypothetical protein
MSHIKELFEHEIGDNFMDRENREINQDTRMKFSLYAMPNRIHHHP